MCGVSNLRKTSLEVFNYIQTNPIPLLAVQSASTNACDVIIMLFIELQYTARRKLNKYIFQSLPQICTYMYGYYAHLLACARNVARRQPETHAARRRCQVVRLSGNVISYLLHDTIRQQTNKPKKNKKNTTQTTITSTNMNVYSICTHEFAVCHSCIAQNHIEVEIHVNIYRPCSI